MDYFKYLSVILGFLMTAFGLWVVLGLVWWKTMVAKLYPEQKPRWVAVLGAGMLVLAAWTGYEFLKHASVYAFAVTAVVGLSLLKTLLLFFFYKNMRTIVLALMTEELALRVVMLSSAAIGAALLMLGLFF